MAFACAAVYIYFLIVFRCVVFIFPHCWRCVHYFIRVRIHFYVMPGVRKTGRINKIKISSLKNMREMWNDQLFKLVAIGYIKPWFNAVSMGLLWNVWTGSLIGVLRTYIWKATRSQDHRFFNCPCSLFHYSSISFHRFSQFPFQSNTFDTNAVNDDDFYYYRSAPFHQLHYKWLFGVIFQNDVGWCMCAGCAWCERCSLLKHNVFI